MWRYLVGAAGALLLAGGGMLWWRSTALAEHTGSRAALAASVGDVTGNSAEGLPEPPTADEKTKEQKRFSRTDHDKDGKITREEYLAARRKNFAKLDKNGDGMLSFEEYAVKAEDKFSDADKDHSGALNPAEFATTRVQRKSRPRAKCPPASTEDKKGDDDS